MAIQAQTRPVNIKPVPVDALNCKLSYEPNAKETVSISNAVTTKAVATPTVPVTAPITTNIKYAPAVKPIAGNYNLYSIGIEWTNNKGPGLSKVTNLARAVANNYKRLSSGQLQFKPIPRSIKVNYAHQGKNLKKAETQVIKIATGGKVNPNDRFMIVNSGVQGFSHGSGNTAHLYGTLYRDGYHEIGHCRPFVLGHSGKYDSTGKLHAYDDGTSFMGRFSSTELTASQLYFLGWLPENKVAQYDLNTPAATFNVENLNTDFKGTGVKAVYIPRPDQRPIFLSMPKVNGKFMFALHLSTGGGSQRVTVFGNKAEYSNLAFEKVADGTGFSTVKISPVTIPAKSKK